MGETIKGMVTSSTCAGSRVSNHPRLYEVCLCDPTQMQRRSFTKIVA